MEERRLQKAVRLIPTQGHCWRRRVHWVGGSRWKTEDLSLCSSWKGLGSQEEITSLILYTYTMIGVRKCACHLHLVQDNKANLSCWAHQRRPSKAKQECLHFQKARIRGLLTRSATLGLILLNAYIFEDLLGQSLKISTYCGTSWDAYEKYRFLNPILVLLNQKLWRWFPRFDISQA